MWMWFGLLNLKQRFPHVGVTSLLLAGAGCFQRSVPADVSVGVASIALAVGIDAGFVFMILGTLSE
jgi:hypothetical protein